MEPMSRLVKKINIGITGNHVATLVASKQSEDGLIIKLLISFKINNIRSSNNAN